jgi:hypothetical protein
MATTVCRTATTSDTNVTQTLAKKRFRYPNRCWRRRWGAGAFMLRLLCSLNYAKCSLHDAKCSLNETKCSLPQLLLTNIRKLKNNEPVYTLPGTKQGMCIHINKSLVYCENLVNFKWTFSGHSVNLQGTLNGRELGAQPRLYWFVGCYRITLKYN